jgi:hypothetical protein
MSAIGSHSALCFSKLGCSLDVFGFLKPGHATHSRPAKLTSEVAQKTHDHWSGESGVIEDTNTAISRFLSILFLFSSADACFAGD